MTSSSPPGADPGLVRLGFDGAERVELDAAGALVLTTPAGIVRQSPPLIYQEAPAGRQEVAGGFALLGGDLVGFRLGTYDPTLPW